MITLNFKQGETLSFPVVKKINGIAVEETAELKSTMNGTAFTRDATITKLSGTQGFVIDFGLADMPLGSYLFDILTKDGSIVILPTAKIVISKSETKDVL